MKFDILLMIIILILKKYIEIGNKCRNKIKCMLRVRKILWIIKNLDIF